jgi:hypothetical protein
LTTALRADRANLEARRYALNAHLCRDAAAAQAAAKRERSEQRKAERAAAKGARKPPKDDAPPQA